MLKASLNGKISSKLDKSEDLLTSNIFGVLDYVTVRSIVSSLLMKSFNLDHDNLSISGNTDKVKFWFWPRFERSEPDVVVSIKTDENEYLIFIEVKYYSGKSGEDDLDTVESDEKFFDQLAREFSDLNQPQTLITLGLPANKVHKYLIYLTLDHVMPKKDLENSIRVIKERVPDEEISLFWLSWRTFYNELECWQPLVESDQRIRIDLLNYFDLKKIKTFTGFNLADEERTNWSYSTVGKEQEADLPQLDNLYFSSMLPISLIGSFYKRGESKV